MTRPLPLAPTQFCSATVPLFEGLEFWLDGNGKVTRSNGTFTEPKPNAFSLPAASVDDPYSHVGGRACPGSTPVCRNSCYVRGLARTQPALYARYQSNADALAIALSTEQGFCFSALRLAEWIEDNAAGGFRWHVSGDVLHARHAEWIVEVCSLAPDVPFWIYTRTLDCVAALTRADNLAVNVSADVDNFIDARAIALRYGARLCYLVENAEHDWEPFHENAPRYCRRCQQYEIAGCGACVPPLPGGSVIFPDYALRGRDLEVPTDAPWWQSLTHEQRAATCGADFFGQSESARCGPCRKCLT